MSKKLLEMKLRHLYKARLRHLKLLLLFRLSLSFQSLVHLYDVNFAAGAVVLKYIK
jgi:hypothetical protein